LDRKVIPNLRIFYVLIAETPIEGKSVVLSGLFGIANYCLATLVKDCQRPIRLSVPNIGQILKHLVHTKQYLWIYTNIAKERYVSVIGQHVVGRSDISVQRVSLFNS